MQPYSQPFFWIQQAATISFNDMKYWFNGLPVDGVKKNGNSTGTVKYWFNGLPIEVVYR